MARWLSAFERFQESSLQPRHRSSDGPKYRSGASGAVRPGGDKSLETEVFGLFARQARTGSARRIGELNKR